MASTDKDEERRDHFWSRKPPEERRPLSDLGRLLFNAPEWQHPFKMVAVGIAVLVVLAMIFAAFTVGGDNSAVVTETPAANEQTPRTLTDREAATVDRTTQSFCDLVHDASWRSTNPNIDRLELLEEYLLPISRYEKRHGSRIPSQLRSLEADLPLYSPEDPAPVLQEMVAACGELGFPQHS